jgi:hypothetical protein
MLESAAREETLLSMYGTATYTVEAQTFVEAENVEFFVKTCRLQIVYSKHF